MIWILHCLWKNTFISSLCKRHPLCCVFCRILYSQEFLISWKHMNLCIVWFDIHNPCLQKMYPYWQNQLQQVSGLEPIPTTGYVVKTHSCIRISNKPKLPTHSSVFLTIEYISTTPCRWRIVLYLAKYQCVHINCPICS